MLFYSPQKHIKLLEKEIEQLLTLKNKTTFTGDSVATYIATPSTIDQRINTTRELIRALNNYGETKINN